MLWMLHMFCVQQPNQVSVFIVTCAIIAGADNPCSIHMECDYFVRIDFKYLDMQNYAMQKINLVAVCLKFSRNPGVSFHFIAPLLDLLSGCGSEMLLHTVLGPHKFKNVWICNMNSQDWVFFYLSVSAASVTPQGSPTLERRMELITILSVRKIFRTW